MPKEVCPKCHRKKNLVWDETSHVFVCFYLDCGASWYYSGGRLKFVED